MRRLTRLALGGALLLAMHDGALAHAVLRKAAPPVGGTVTAAPAEVEVTFSQAVEPRFSTIVVTDATGHRVDKADVHAVSGDATRIAVTLETLPPGDYKVVWQATSRDTHKTDGQFTFSVRR